MENKKKLTWDEIKALYDQEYVELIDYEWEETEPWPNAGVVRAHAPSRKEFNKLMLAEPLPNDSALVFVGPKRLKDGVIFFPNLNRRIILCDHLK